MGAALTQEDLRRGAREVARAYRIATGARSARNASVLKTLSSMTRLLVSMDVW